MRPIILAVMGAQSSQRAMRKLGLYSKQQMLGLESGFGVVISVGIRRLRKELELGKMHDSVTDRVEDCEKAGEKRRMREVSVKNLTSWQAFLSVRIE